MILKDLPWAGALRERFGRRCRASSRSRTRARPSTCSGRRRPQARKAGSRGRRFFVVPRLPSAARHTHPPPTHRPGGGALATRRADCTPRAAPAAPPPSAGRHHDFNGCTQCRLRWSGSASQDRNLDLTEWFLVEAPAPAPSPLPGGSRKMRAVRPC